MTLHRSEPVFQVWYTYRPVRAFAWKVAIAVVVYLVLKLALPPNPRRGDFPILGIMLTVYVIVFALDMLSHFWHHGPLLESAAERRPWLQLDVDELTFRDGATFPWSEIAEVRSVEVGTGTKGGEETFLVLVLSDIRARFRHPAEVVDRLQGDNAAILRKRAGKLMNLPEHAFLSLRIGAPGSGALSLSASCEEIVAEAKRRLRLAQGRRQAAEAQAAAPAEGGVPDAHGGSAPSRPIPTAPRDNVN